MLDGLLILLGLLTFAGYAMDQSVTMRRIALVGGLLVIGALLHLLLLLRRRLAHEGGGTASRPLHRIEPGGLERGNIEPAEIEPGENEPGEIEPGEIEPGEIEAGHVEEPERPAIRVPPPAPELGPLLATGIWLPARILYTDAQNRMARHELIVQHVVGWRASDLPDQLGAIAGWDVLRQEARTLSLSRIAQLIDPGTDEVVESPEAWLLSMAGIDVPLGAWRAVRPEPPPPPCLLVWQSAPGELEAYDIEIGTVETVADRPVAITAHARRRRTDSRPPWSGERRFSLMPPGEVTERPVAIAWTADEVPERDVVGWIARLIAPSAVRG